MKIDISIILNLHREDGYLLRTMMSLKEAAAFARSQGIATELVIVLDRPNEVTRKILNKIDLSRFAYTQILETDFGSPSLARNTGKAVAKGKYILFWDGDDLMSFNMLAAMFFEAERNREKTIVFHEWLFAFGKRSFYAQYVDLRFVTPLSLLDVHTYTARGFYDRAICDRIDFSDANTSSHCVYEDWKFNCDAIALGYDCKIVEDTILFYRQKANGHLIHLNQSSVRSILHSKFFEPKLFVQICQSSVEQIRSSQLPQMHLKGRQYFENPTCRLLTSAANRIDAEVDPELIRGEEYVVSKTSQLSIGLAYYDICTELNEKKFAHVFLVPWVIRGGADKYLINIGNTIGRLRPKERILVITGQVNNNNNIWASKYSDAVTVIDLAQYLPSIGEDGVNLITLKIIQAACSEATIHFRVSEFAFGFIRRFIPILSQHKTIMYQFGIDARNDGIFHFTVPFSPSFVSEIGPYISKLVIDNEACISYFLDRTHTEGKWAVLPTLCNPTLKRKQAIERTQKSVNKVLWASRLAFEKRPQLLIEIARLLISSKPDLIIEVWGIPENSFDIQRLNNLSNVICKGTYQSFETIAREDFLCFIYTSYFDGLPTVLLEAASAGLPIVASDVGGVKAFVKNDETGILIPSLASDEKMAVAYVEAIDCLVRDPKCRADFVARAYDRLINNHSTDAYIKALKHILDI